MFGRRHDCNRLLFLDVLNRVKDRVNRNIGFRGVSSALELRDFVLLPCCVPLASYDLTRLTQPLS